ncbi:MAG: hypothetical protein ACXWYO_00055 [Gaiellaceae bacterium]
MQIVPVERRAAYHRVRVVHGGTGKPLEPIHARLVEPAWHGWLLRVRGSDVILSTLDRFAGDRPPSTELEVRVGDPVTAARFPLVDGVRGVGTISLLRDATVEVDLSLVPEPVRLEVDLVRRDGTARAGLADVEAQNGTDTVALPETTPGSGRYAASAVWRPGSYRISAGGAQRGAAAVDYRRALTTVRLIVP